MDAKTIFTKTAKGITQLNQRTQSLSRQETNVLKAIDGRSSIGVLSDKLGLAIPKLGRELLELKKEGLIKVFEVRNETPLSDFGDDDDDFDFTTPSKIASALKNSVAGFGPSKFRRAGVDEQVDRADTLPGAPDALIDEVEEIAAKIAERKKQEQAQRINADALAAARGAVQHAQAEARARAEREAQIRARLEVEANARKDAEARVIEEARRATAAAEAARKDLEAKLAEEARKREEYAASTKQLTEAQQAKHDAAQKALSEARAKAEAEAKAFAAARSKIEIEMRALTEARAEAEAAAKRQEAELAGAQRDLRAQLKAEIGAKVRAEMDVLLKSDIKESGRAEVEAAVAAEAREEARRRLEEVLSQERISLARIVAEAKASAEIDAKRMLADQEARLRAEMESRLAELAAEKLQVEIEARKMVEAQSAAGAVAAAEFAARLKAEEEARRVVEEEANERRNRDEIERKRLEAQAHAEALARAEAAAEARAATAAAAAMEARLQAEAGARARAEAEAEDRRKAEQLKAARLEARTKEDADMRAATDAKMQAKLAAEKQARIEAQAKALLEADLREKAARKSSAELESAQRARAEAEQRADRETRGREIASQAVAQQVAEKEKIAELAEQRIATERAARERAEAKAYADERAVEAQRQAQVERLRELTAQAEYAARAPVQAVAGKRKRRIIKKQIPVSQLIALGVVALIVLAVVAIQVVPLGAVNSKLEKALAVWVHDDVLSSRLRISLFPKPHIKLDQVALGKVLDATAASGKIYMDVGAIFGDKFVIETIELKDVSVSAEALPRIMKWASAENRGTQVEIGRIVLSNVKLDIKGVPLEAFDAELSFDRKGALVSGSARTRDGKWSIETAVDTVAEVVEGAVRPWTVEIAARNWTPPVGAAIPLAVLSGKGTWADGRMFFPEFNAKLLEGSADGNLTISFPSSADPNAILSARSEFTVARMKVGDLVGNFTGDVSMSGRLDGSFTASVSATTVGALMNMPTVSGDFMIRDGAMSNVDLVQAMRSPGNVGGQTKYSELAGKLRISDGIIRYESLKMAGGLLFAGGNLNVTYGTGVLNGTLNSEIRSKVAQDRAVFAVSGTVARPLLKRGG